MKRCSIAAPRPGHCGCFCLRRPARGRPTTPIRHIVVLMQENHSFDNYFGTYPGADGLPAGTCLPKSFRNAALGCVRPAHVGGGAVLGLASDPTLFARQFHGGRMDGFVAAYRIGRGLGGLPNPLGYYDERDLPFAWNLADRYVLFDRFFSSARGGSVWNHLFAVTATPGNRRADELPPAGYPDTTTIFDRLEAAGVPWRFYVKDYDPTNTIAHPVLGERASQLLQVPLLAMPRVLRSPRLTSNIVDMQEFYRDAQTGRLPAVSYIAPGGVSEHPPAKLVAGQTFVRSIVNELMRSPEWSSTAFVLTYDSWGGWYDHVRPPKVDRYGYGFRVPALLVSPYAKRGAIDHDDARLHVDPAFHRGQLAARSARATRRERQQHRDGVRLLASATRPRVRPGDSRLPDGGDSAYARGLLGVRRRCPARSRADRGCTGRLAPATLDRGGRATGEPRTRGRFRSMHTARQPWERLPEEPDAAWHAFVLYRDMGSGSRSQRAVRAALRLEPRGAPPDSRMRQWSVDWRWVERCRAYDAYTALEGSR